MNWKTPTGLLLVCAVILATQSALRAQQQQQNIQWTVKDGVYTLAQAERGVAAVNKADCGYCHGDGLGGGKEETPGLYGPEFVLQWNNLTLRDLFVKLHEMPPDGSAELTDQEYVDVLAYLLQLNGYPAGDYELTTDPEYLRTIQIVFPD